MGERHRVLGLKICRFEEISGNAGTAAACGTDGCIFLRFERLQGRRSLVLCLWAVKSNVVKPPPGRSILADQIRSLTSLTPGQVSRAFGFVRMTLTAGPLRSLPQRTRLGMAVRWGRSGDFLWIYVLETSKNRCLRVLFQSLPSSEAPRDAAKLQVSSNLEQLLHGPFPGLPVHLT